MEKEVFPEGIPPPEVIPGVGMDIELETVVVNDVLTELSPAESVPVIGVDPMDNKLPAVVA